MSAERRTPGVLRAIDFKSITTPGVLRTTGVDHFFDSLLRFKSIIATILLLLTISVTAAETYYIDKITGSDSNDGLSPEAAWQNVEKVNETTFSPGDSILFQRGQVWFNTLKITSQGTEEQPVFFGAYGSGGKPRFDAQDQRINGISIRGASYVRLYNLVSINTGLNSVGVSIKYSHHIVLRQVDALFSANWEKSGPGMAISNESHHIIVDSALEGEEFDFVDIVEAGMTSYTDATVAAEQQQHYYHVRAYNNRGNSEASNTVSIVTAVRTQPASTAPADFRLYANYPNPFNPSTTIRYAVPASAHLRIEIYDVSGRLVDTLVDGVQAPGDHRVSWEARSSAGKAVAAGLYFCVMTADEVRLARKMILVR